jgi:hypothetical protein
MEITIERGIIKIDGKPVSFPRDVQFSPVSVLYGINPSGKLVPVKIDSDGKIELSADVELKPGDIKIGAVEIEDVNTENLRLDIVSQDLISDLDNYRGILVFGKNYEDNKIKLFSLDAQGKLKAILYDTNQNHINPATSEDLQAILTEIKKLNKVYEILNGTLSITPLGNQEINLSPQGFTYFTLNFTLATYNKKVKIEILQSLVENASFTPKYVFEYVSPMSSDFSFTGDDILKKNSAKIKISNLDTNAITVDYLISMKEY